PTLNAKAARTVSTENTADAPVLQAVGLEQRKPVESRRVAAGIGAGAENLDTVAAGQTQRELVHRPLVQDVGAVAGRSGQNDRSGPSPAARAQAVLDRFAERFGEAAELSDVQIHPSRAVGPRLFRDQ